MTFSIDLIVSKMTPLGKVKCDHHEVISEILFREEKSTVQ